MWLANMKYTVHQAKTNLCRLLAEASSGRQVIIARGSAPGAKLLALGAARSKREPGKFAGQITCTAGAFEPPTERELPGLGFE